MTTIAEPLSAAQPTATAGSEQVIGGVDTHADTHTAALIDATGRLLGHHQFPTTPAGYTALLAWMSTHSVPAAVGIEGTGTYGAGLARHLAGAGVRVVEVDRPDRKMRRFAGKSDPIDAEAAARAVLSGRAAGIPKQRTGAVEAIRALRVPRRSAISARTQTVVQLKNMLITAPEPLRTQLRALSTPALLATCAQLRPDPAAPGDATAATKSALRTLARRHAYLCTEIADLDAALASLVATTAPALLTAYGVGTDVAGQLLVTAGDNPQRLHSEPAFAALCGVSPIPASPGRTHRHRLNRGGDRQANAALHRVAITRMRWDERTRAYVTRRTSEGLSKKEIIRCLKRLIARELYYLITKPTPLDHP